MANQVDDSGLLRGYAASMGMGRLFAIQRDFGVILAPSTFGLAPAPYREVTVSDSSVTPSSTICA